MIAYTLYHTLLTIMLLIAYRIINMNALILTGGGAAIATSAESVG